NRMGFALLGEVLLRRNDYERAVPVLQHAQNLDPTSPAILSMLKRARASSPLDPPPPIPQPVPPRGETNYGISLDEQPPRSAPSRSAPLAPAASAVAPTMALRPSLDAEPAYGYEGMSQTGRGQKRSTAPPPHVSTEGVRPRVVSTTKPQ